MTALFVMHQMHFSHPTPTECDPIGAAVTYTTPQYYHDGIHGRINTSNTELTEPPMSDLVRSVGDVAATTAIEFTSCPATRDGLKQTLAARRLSGQIAGSLLTKPSTPARMPASTTKRRNHPRVVLRKCTRKYLYDY